MNYQLDGIFVTLFEVILLQLKSLFIQKHSAPDCVCQRVAYTTSSTLVEILVLGFCFVDLLISAPRPKDMTPPVWLFMSGWTAKAASTYHLI